MIDTFRDYLYIHDAAQFVGVSKSTLRNWERRGKLPAHRHPNNRYRLSKRTELEALLRQAAQASTAPKGGEGSG